MNSIIKKKWAGCRWLRYVRLFLCMLCCLSPCYGVQALDVRVHDVPVRTVLAGLARSAGINLLVDDTVDGQISMELVDVTAVEAIEAIATSQDLVYERDGDIAFLTAGRSHDKARRCYTWQLHYADPENLKETAEALVPDGSLRYHNDTNALVLSGTAREAAAVDALVQRLDKPVRQVDVEVEILSLNKEAIHELGLDWRWSSLEGGPGHRAFVYEGQLHALESTGNAKLLARPHLVAGNGKEAQILIGDRIPVLTEHVDDGEVSRTTEYEDAGIKLVYKPRIHADGSVTAHIPAEVSTPLLVPELKAYRITTRRADTEVCLPPGQDLVIGGLISRETVDNWRKVPILGDIPLLGRIFRHHYKGEKETEVVLVIRSRVLPLTGKT